MVKTKDGSNLTSKDAVSLALMQQSLANMEKIIPTLATKEELSNGLKTFDLPKKIVYGACYIILTAVLVAFIAVVIYKPSVPPLQPSQAASVGSSATQLRK
jgi:hypothetical protein